MLDFFLHLDDKLGRLCEQYGPWIYAILFIVVFCETGLVVTPFLPGDSLLFAAGVFAHADNGKLNIFALYLVFAAAALAGDNVNYQIGRHIGKRLFRSESARIFRPSRLAATHAYFERHGGKTVVLARFVPVLRNLAPFVAGMGRMTYRSFLKYETVGAALWTFACVTTGFLFSRIPFVSKHPLWAVAALFGLCVAGIVWEWIRFRKEGPRPGVNGPGTRKAEVPESVVEPRNENVAS